MPGAGIRAGDRLDPPPTERDARPSLGPRTRSIAALAVDFDRTLVRPGDLPTAIARDALAGARSLGLRVVLSSGREHQRLREFAATLGEVDALVAENGAVVEAPVGARPSRIGWLTGMRVRRRLAQDPKLAFDRGQVVVSVAREDRARLAGLVAGLPVILIANVDRVMVLPRGVTKVSGVRRAMRQLGLRAHGYAAIGDAENDLDLLMSAMLSGAVANADAGVREAADYVCAAPFELGVAEFVQGPLARRLRRSAHPVRRPRRAA